MIFVNVNVASVEIILPPFLIFFQTDAGRSVFCDPAFPVFFRSKLPGQQGYNNLGFFQAGSLIMIFHLIRMLEAAFFFPLVNQRRAAEQASRQPVLQPVGKGVFYRFQMLLPDRPVIYKPVVPVFMKEKEPVFLRLDLIRPRYHRIGERIFSLYGKIPALSPLLRHHLPLPITPAVKTHLKLLLSVREKMNVEIGIGHILPQQKLHPVFFIPCRNADLPLFQFQLLPEI